MRKIGNRSFAERLYKMNVLPDGNLRQVEDVTLVIKKLENPPLEDEEQPMNTN